MSYRASIAAVALAAALLSMHTTAQALDVTEALTGARPDPANHGRTLDRLPGLRRTDQHAEQRQHHSHAGIHCSILYSVATKHQGLELGRSDG